MNKILRIILEMFGIFVVVFLAGYSDFLSFLLTVALVFFLCLGWDKILFEKKKN